MKIKYIAYSSDNILDLKGIGMEFLLNSQGFIIAVFINGMINGRNVLINSETMGNEITLKECI